MICSLSHVLSISTTLHFSDMATIPVLDVEPLVCVALRPPEVTEAATKPLQKHSPGGYIIDVPRRTAISGGHIVLLYGAEKHG